MKGLIILHPLHHPYFVKFIVYFNKNQDFFECHEVLEDYWKEQPNFDKSHPLTAYILLATGLYHWRRGNFIGAEKTLAKAYKKMSYLQHVTPLFADGIDFPLVYKNLAKSMHAVKEKQPFQSFPIEITSAELQTLYQRTAENLTLLPPNSKAIIDKHLLRPKADLKSKKKR